MENLLINAIGHSENNVINELAKLAGMHDCLINYSYLYTLGTDNSVILQLTGNWSSIAKVESALPVLAERLSIQIISRRNHLEKVNRYHLPYAIEINAVDQPGIVFEIVEFFNSLEVHVERMESTTTSHQQTPILQISMEIDIPAENNIADVREQFLIFCDALNLDGTMEPRK